jgi:myo-inositol-1(or 4)-monophosphatase
MTDRSGTTPEPSDPDPAALAETAARAVEAGGAYLGERFQSGATEAEYTAMDVKTAADHEAERRILDVLETEYPTFAVSSEEAGERDGEGYRWVVDPLDGTNNFAAGIPTFGVAAAACGHTVPNGGHPDAGWMAGDPDPLAAAVSVPVLDDRYVATRGEGVRYNGTRVTVSDGDHRALETGTVGMIIGKPVLTDDGKSAEWGAITDAVEFRCKRAIQTWAPVVYWGLFARGKLDGFVSFYPDEREQAAGHLLAREAGAHERSEGALSVFGATDAICDELWDAAAGALE